mgnify:CR=1 FL=1
MNFYNLASILFLILYAVHVPAQDLPDEFDEIYRSYEEAFNNNDLEVAQTLAKQAMNMAVTSIGEDHDKSAILMINLGHVLVLSGKSDEAESYLSRAEEIIVGKFGTNHESLITVHEDLAAIYANKGDVENTRHKLIKAINLRKLRWGEDDPKIINLLRSQAQIDVAANKLDSAGDLLIQAIGIVEKNYGATDPTATAIIISLGDIAFNKNDFTDAENLYQQALKLFEEKLDEDDPRIVSLHAKLAEFYITQQNDKYSDHADKVIALIKTEETAAQPLFIIKPLLPGIDAEQLQGTILFEFNVTNTGKVTNPKIIESEPVNTFDQATLEAVSKWRFLPKYENGSRVDQPGTRARITILENSVQVYFGDNG